VEIGPVEFTEQEKKFVADLQKAEGQAPYWDNEIKPFELGVNPVVDSSEYTWICPYNLLVLNLGPGPGWHNWMVTACSGSTHGEKVVDKAAQIMAASAADIICDEKLMKAAKDEWMERMKGRKYDSLLPPGTPVPLGVNKATMDKYRPLYKD
jgi:aminobenzoyl-glutamate utilization protein B